MSNAGGLGLLPAALLSAASLRDELAAITSSTTRPFNVNFFCHSPPPPDEARESAWRQVLAPHYAELGLDPASVPAAFRRTPFDPEAADIIDAFRPAVVSFHFGLPSQALLGRMRAIGARVVSSATTVEEALWLERRGVDAIVAQGLEAGGHRGHFLSDDLSRQAGTFALLPQIVRAVRVPVIAAGGIADAHAVTAALALGASAVQVGTAFLLCPEVTTSPVHRAAIAGDEGRHTAVTNLFTGRPARAIVTRLMRELGALSDQPRVSPRVHRGCSVARRGRGPGAW